jgi:hypothetical protein
MPRFGRARANLVDDEGASRRVRANESSLQISGTHATCVLLPGGLVDVFRSRRARIGYLGAMNRAPDPPAPNGSRWVNVAYAMVYRVIAAFFAVCAVLLVGLAALEVASGISDGNANLQSRFSVVLEAIGMLTIAVAALELSQTVWEEEVQRKALMSAPTRVRRFISRFLVVVVVALAIESLIGAFRFVHDQPERLPHAAAIAIGAAALLVAWGAFIRLNLAAEALEPEAMAQAKREDKKIDENKAEPPGAEGDEAPPPHP